MNSYNTKYYSILLLLCGMPYCALYAQDSIPTQNIPEFQVSEKVEIMFSEINTQSIDSTILRNNNTNNLGSLLAKNSAITLRAYGVTGISSISMRGGNSNHVAVMWNGFNIQDPLNGGVNFFQSSSNFTDAINIQYGGSSSAFGSGAVGGVIHLDNKPKFNNSFFGSTMLKTGSFGLNAQHLQFGYGGKKLSSQVRVFHSKVNNDFEFSNEAKKGAPIERYFNANNNQYGILHELYYKINNKQLLSSQIWYQHNYRNVPGNMTVLRQEGVEENLTDDWIRWGLNWNRKGDKVNYEARTGIFYNKSKYVNSTLDLNSNYSSVRSVSELMATVKLWKSHRLAVGVLNNYTSGVSDNFNPNPTLNSLALYIAPSFKLNKKVTLNTGIREEFYNEDLTPLTYSINTRYLFYKNWYTTISFSKNYRTPNFNDLYWNGGFAKGNINLKSENGYSKDIGLGIKKQNNSMSIHSEATFYHNTIDDQIQWIPEGQNWMPVNISKVETKGIELKCNSTFKISRKSSVIFNLNYAYTDAQIKEKSSNESDEVLNKQLIYIPYYQGNTYFGFKVYDLLLDVNLQYVGYQFTRADNLEWLDAYFLTDIGLSYVFNKTKYSIQLFTKANNIFNTIYQVRQWYPMPPTNYEIGINLTLK